MLEPDEAPLPFQLAPRHALNLVLFILGLLLTVGMLVQTVTIYTGLLITEFVLLLLPTWLFCRSLGLAPAPTLLLGSGRRLPPLAAVGMGLLAFAMALAITFPVLLLVFLAGGSYAGPVLPLDTLGQFLLALAAGAVAAPICEEILFRGFVLRALAPMGPHAAVWIGAVLFGLFHMDPVRFVPTMALGVVYGYLAAGTGSVRSSIVAHAVNNGLALTLAFVGSSGKPTGDLGLEGLRQEVSKRLAESGTGLTGTVSPDLVLLAVAAILGLAGLVLVVLVAWGLRGLAGQRPDRFCLPGLAEVPRQSLAVLARSPAFWVVLALAGSIWGRGLWLLFPGQAA